MSRSRMSAMFLEQKRLTLSKASQDYNPDLRVAKYNLVMHQPSKYTIPKQKRLPNPKILCDRIYSPQHSATDRHVFSMPISKQLPSMADIPKPICDTSYDPNVNFVKAKSPAAQLYTRMNRSQPAPGSKHEDNVYNPKFTNIEKQITHSNFIAKQAGRDRAVMPTPVYQSFYDPVKPYPKHGVSAFANISNARSTDVGNLSKELDFLIQQTESSWKHVDDTLAEFTEAVKP
ncbi:MAG: hypothetical protein EZS28_022235 [Streblomastix strix]|uniref:Uncharacterized protein n=1 Tax=Streblomastix strix TaxID=222440 RepID=A0A5J4VIR0_9EUKA|nr:MAG: hypothetical protein EZS28_022235 [Streblomastix strix]